MFVGVMCKIKLYEQLLYIGRQITNNQRTYYDELFQIQNRFSQSCMFLSGKTGSFRFPFQLCNSYPVQHKRLPQLGF